MDFAAIASQPFTAALTNIFLALFTLILTALGRVAVTYISARTTIAQRRTLTEIAGIAVTTSEQLALANSINPNAKKQYAEGIVAHELDQIGLSVTPTQIDTAIESAVYTTFNQWKDAPTTPATPATDVAPAAAS